MSPMISCMIAKPLAMVARAPSAAEMRSAGAAPRCACVRMTTARPLAVACRASASQMEAFLGNGLANSAAVAKMLREEKKWHPYWIDGVTDKMERRVLKTDPKMAKAAVEFLESVGLTSQEICNMCSISAQFLGRTPDELRPIITYVADKVDRNKALTRKAIAENPKMLEYNVDASKEFLVKPHGGRCTVQKTQAHGMDAVHVHFWREGASFGTAPVSPKRPGSP